MNTNNIVEHLNISLDVLKTLVTEINRELTRDQGEPHRLLSHSGLESALGQFYQGWYTEEQRIAAVYRSLVLNHAFENGNKRTAFVIAVLLKSPAVTAKELERLTIKLASSGGGKIKVNEIANALYGTNYEV